MTPAQIDKLVSDGDLIPGDGVFLLEGMNYEFGDDVWDCLSNIFDEYLQNYVQQEIWNYTSVINSRLSLIPNTEIKKSYLKGKVLKTLSKLDDDLKNYNDFEQDSEYIKEAWHYSVLISPQTASLIECLKFTVLSGKKITEYGASYHNRLPKRNALDEFFTTKEMYKLYSVAAKEHQMLFLQKRINELDQPVAQQIKAIQKTQLEAAAVAMMAIYYKKENIIYVPLVKKVMKELGLETENLTTSYITTVSKYAKEFIDEKGIINIKKQTNSKTSRLRQLQSIIPFTKGKVKKRVKEAYQEIFATPLPVPHS